jgi:hypothetical protein
MTSLLAIRGVRNFEETVIYIYIYIYIYILVLQQSRAGPGTQRAVRGFRGLVGQMLPEAGAGVRNKIH